jgi:hypothetical protein
MPLGVSITVSFAKGFLNSIKTGRNPDLWVSYWVRLLRMYSVATVLSGKGLVGAALISLTTLTGTLSVLFIQVIPKYNYNPFTI